MNELHKLMFKRIAFLTQLAMEHTSIIDVKLFTRGIVLFYIFVDLASISVGHLRITSLLVSGLSLLALALAKAEHLD